MPMQMRMRMQMRMQFFAFPAKALGNLKQLATQAMKGVNSSFKHADQTMRYKHAKQLKQADLTTVYSDTQSMPLRVFAPYLSALVRGHA